MLRVWRPELGAERTGVTGRLPVVPCREQRTPLAPAPPLLPHIIPGGLYLMGRCPGHSPRPRQLPAEREASDADRPAVGHGGGRSGQGGAG